MAQVTSYDVATRAGVSQSAVSRAFSANGKVSSTTRQRVLDAARELGYKPNLLARSLITGRTNMVAVLASQTTGRYYPEVVQYLADALGEAGKKMLLFYTDGRIERVEDVLNEVSCFQVDGIITSTQFAPDRRELIRGLNTPMVLFNRQDPLDEFRSVICDQNQGAACIASALLAGGRRRIAILAGSADNYVARHRLFGTIDALGSAHVGTVDGDFSYECGITQASALWALKPDAIMCMNDSMAMGVMDGLADLGVGVPADVWVTGFDGTAAGRLKRYDLTTWVQPLDQMVAQTCALLDALMAGNEGHSQVLQGSMHIGRSAPL
ncbi:LacI family DNA-binding transcriptional regulator [Litorivicinus lipolyticus]|uniref:LacI family DNA-binding transcriptional regulator n=1 Tax=Litorivicinus lipolyticus TaxID=418701 RepID=UPI003B59AF35